MASVFSASFALRAGRILLRSTQQRLVPTQALSHGRWLATGDGAANKYDTDYFETVLIPVCL